MLCSPELCCQLQQSRAGPMPSCHVAEAVKPLLCLCLSAQHGEGMGTGPRTLQPRSAQHGGRESPFEGGFSSPRSLVSRAGIASASPHRQLLVSKRWGSECTLPPRLSTVPSPPAFGTAILSPSVQGGLPNFKTINIK